MPRAKKQGADWFAHRAHHGKTMFILEARFGNDGYAAWFRLLEMLTSASGHYLSVSAPSEWQYLTAKWRVSDETAEAILALLAELDAIDKELWTDRRVIWSQNLVDSLAPVYRDRKMAVPQRPVETPPNHDEEVHQEDESTSNPDEEVQQGGVSPAERNTQTDRQTERDSAGDFPAGFPPSPPFHVGNQDEAQEPADDADIREATETIGYDHLRARGRPPGWDAKDEGRLVEIIRRHGAKPVVAAFRRFLARSPPDKPAHWFVQDWESIWQPARRPSPKQRRCTGCGAVLVSGSCLACGMAPGEPPEPRATAEDAKGLVVQR